MNLHALRLFYEVASLGSVTKAAAVLHISQPAVTAQIRNLEKELALTLLSPHGRGVILTEAGGLVYTQAARLFALELEMTRQITAYREGSLGKLRLAATYLPANHLLPAWMAAFKTKHERIEMSLTTSNSRASFNELLHYEADLAFVGGSKEAPEGLLREELLNDELWFVVPAKHPLAGMTVSLALMLQQPFVLREEGSSSRETLFALCRQHQVQLPQIGLQFNGQHETMRAVISGYGATFISALEAAEYIHQQALARVYVEDIYAPNPIAVYRRSDEDLSPASEQFLKHVYALTEIQYGS
ncbi:DNA-binding transcriptional regulator, LysR family [Paenibacillus sp. 1_12]|uniref:LysR family transcriptional regulator n=1 Tax=Paenibacillus sp. 1_12 TaxID=1566278 RepID=UPI0008F0E6EB|nr:LysR family transcriptional regulator [Paenibacillus sp. 1_12]SFL26232.1 DNA-binding transcriptional regulator, LysR family [Paenibacillus sp. 1_12]